MRDPAATPPGCARANARKRGIRHALWALLWAGSLLTGPALAASVTLTAPSNGAIQPAPATFSIVASAPGAVRVQFFQTGGMISGDAKAPFTATFSTSTPGTYSLWAHAFGSDGSEADSAPVTVTVTGASNSPPTVSLTSPANGASAPSPAVFTLTANASDSDGSITHVQFYAGSLSLGTATSAPYTATFSKATPGSYSLTAVATDNSGASTASGAVSVTVGAPPNVALTRTYVYDAHQRLCKRIEPETGATVMDYDAAGNVIWTATGAALTANTCDRASVAASAKTLRTYDTLNRPLTVDVPNSANDIAYSYFADGALKTLSSGTNTWTYSYNKRRLPLTESLAIDGRIKTISHAYNPLGQESSITYPSGLSVATNPNALGQPTQAGSYAASIRYFANGGMSGFTYGNGIVHTLTQNARELPLRSLDQQPGHAAILDDTYSYDANANVAAIADGTSGMGNSRTMTYDDLDRLTATSAPHQWWINASTSYDALDNIRNNTVGGRSYDYAYNANWQLAQMTRPDGTAAFTLSHDANGNVTSKGAGNDSYSFDAANRMLAVTNKESYQYDGYGRRVKVVAANGKTDYPIYSMSGQLLSEDDQRNGNTTDYISLNGSLVAKRSAIIGSNTWTTTYEHTDALHSPTYETNSTGTLTRVELYTPYGEPGDGSYSQGPGYTGHVTDAATGLTYAQQRYYDPVIAQFLSPDPDPVDTTTGYNFNRFNYAGGNPYKFTDPDGRAFGLDDLVGSGVGGLVGMGVEAAKDLYTGEPITKGNMAGAFVGGALMGEGIVNAPETLGGSVVAAGVARGAAVGLVSNTVQQGTDIASGEQKSYSVKSAVVSTTVGAVTAGVLSKVGTVKVPGVTAGRNSMAAVAKGVKTRIANGNASNMSAKTMAKGVIGSQVGDAGKTAVGGAIDATKTKVCQRTTGC